MSVDLTTPLEDLAGSDALVVGGRHGDVEEVLFVRLGRVRGERIPVRMASAMRSTAPRPPFLSDVEARLHRWALSGATQYTQVWFPAGATVGDLALTRIRPVRAQPVQLRFPVLTSALAPVWLAAVAVALFVLGAPLHPMFTAVAAVILLVAGALPWIRTGLRPQVLGPAPVGRQRGIGPSAAERVQVVRTAYGALLGDVVYRIDNSALFDAAVDQTARFQAALVAWDASQDDAAATEVEESFRAARVHAEALGLRHLPETAREDAARASKATKVALSSDSPAERLAAARAAASLLASLSLYFMPVIDAAAPSLMGGRRSIGPGSVEA